MKSGKADPSSGYPTFIIINYCSIRCMKYENVYYIYDCVIGVTNFRIKEACGIKVINKKYWIIEY